MSFATPALAMGRLGRLGTRSPAHLAEAIAAAAVRLTADELDWLEYGDGPASFEMGSSWTA